MAKRQKNDNPPPEPKVGIPAGGSVIGIPLDKIELEDRSFQFRLVERTAGLKESLQNEGQQVPVILRKREGKKYQILCGFRRIKAIGELGWPIVKAIVRDDFEDDAAAFRTALLENVHRKSYSDVDRAYAIKAFKDRGYQGGDVAELLGLSRRRAEQIQGLLELPEEVQQAIDDPEQYFSSTHALVLKQAKAKYPDLDFGNWIGAVNEKQLSVAQLKLALGKKYAATTKDGGYDSIFNEKGSKWAEYKVRLSPRSLDLKGMSAEDLAAFEAELDKLKGLITEVRGE